MASGFAVLGLQPHAGACIIGISCCMVCFVMGVVYVSYHRCSGGRVVACFFFGRHHDCLSIRPGQYEVMLQICEVRFSPWSLHSFIRFPYMRFVNYALHVLLALRGCIELVFLLCTPLLFVDSREEAIYNIDLAARRVICHRGRY